MLIDDRFTRKLTLAVRLRDDFSGAASLVDQTSVYIEENGARARKNSNHYYVFTDLAGPTYTLRVVNRCYLGQTVTVTISNLDRRNPVVPITVRPNSNYPFPPASTLIRGIIASSAGEPVAGAQVNLVDSDIASGSDQDGRFVLYCQGLLEDNIVVSGARRYLSFGGDTALKVRVAHPSFLETTELIGVVAEGMTTLHRTPITLSN